VRTCMDCGACCREGFHVVGVEEDDLIVQRHPHLVAMSEGLRVVPRPAGRCAALACAQGPPWQCAVYADRPQACRDFEMGGPHCLDARRRVGLSRN
jgi:Fe-S-cluster containining protein